MKGKLNKKSNEDKEWPLEQVFPGSPEAHYDSSKMEKIRQEDDSNLQSFPRRRGEQFASSRFAPKLEKLGGNR